MEMSIKLQEVTALFILMSNIMLLSLAFSSGKYPQGVLLLVRYHHKGGYYAHMYHVIVSYYYMSRNNS